MLVWLNTLKSLLIIFYAFFLSFEPNMVLDSLKRFQVKSVLLGRRIYMILLRKRMKDKDQIFKIYGWAEISNQSMTDLANMVNSELSMLLHKLHGGYHKRGYLIYTWISPPTLKCFN
ncbi:uncharacterized protein LOC127085424 [Lathyrus oleraceus]|uniref:Uncharacterized protein n=1 Tax=Pisum sativum TaxID=3888 RepID=A0A9D4X0M1_PEA|nr:uncharacterized protein LOC127085424 [Pisum sativum]KAI5410155.1 hypothetical protein KIW84_055582 [Pisum sativum]